MKVAISGASGLIGKALVSVLGARGHDVVPLVRGGRGSGMAWDPLERTVDEERLGECDAVVNLSGERIRAGRWTAKHKRAVLESRTRTTRFLAETLAGLPTPPRALLSASAVGFYGDHGDDQITESSASTDGFLVDVCQAWEAATAPAEAAGIRTVHLRTGLVLSADGGLLDPFVLPGGVAVAGRLGSGRQWMSWVTIGDEVGAIAHLLDADVSGPVNITAPNPVPNREFSKTLAGVLGRPTLPPVPAAIVRLLFGREAADQTALVSQRVLPEALLASGYRFEHEGLEPALRSVLDR